MRDERIDSVKYWLIVLVILGHALRRKELVDITECITIWKWIYIFHMPLFIFLSGYFSRKKDNKDFFPSLWKILEPLLLIQGIIKIAGIIIKGRVSLISLFTPWDELWYLQCLVYWRILLQIIPNRLLSNQKLILSITFCLSMIVGFFPFGFFLELQRAFSLMPFFFLGYYMKEQNLFLPGSRDGSLIRSIAELVSRS